MNQRFPGRAARPLRSVGLLTPCCAALLLSLVTLAGCDSEKPAGGATTKASGGAAARGGSGGGGGGGAGAVAVVDLDRVATDLGWIREMQANLMTLDQQLRTDLGRVRDLYDAQIQARQKELAPGGPEKLTPAQRETLMQMVAAGRQELAQLQTSAQQQFATYRGDWVKQYREALGPIIRQAAAVRGVSVVLTKTDQVLFADAANADITDLVVDAAREKPPVLHPVPLPILNVPSGGQLGMPGSTTNPSATQPATKPATRPAAPR